MVRRVACQVLVNVEYINSVVQHMSAIFIVNKTTTSAWTSSNSTVVRRKPVVHRLSQAEVSMFPSSALKLNQNNITSKAYKAFYTWIANVEEHSIEVKISLFICKNIYIYFEVTFCHTQNKTKKKTVVGFAVTHLEK